MAKNDILGTKKVRTTPEYTARTHWAGSVNFAAIFTAPVLYLLLPVLVLYVTGCFKLLANGINQLAGSAVFNQYGVMAIFALILWQVVVCWIVWCKEIKKYEDAPKYEYLFYNDIMEYKTCNVPTPKFIKVLKFLINLIPIIVIIAVLGVAIFLIIDNIKLAPPSGNTPGNNPGAGGDATVTIDWAAVWAAISNAFTTVFGAIWSFVSNQKILPYVIGAIVLLVIILILVAIFKKKPEATTKAIKARTLPARTLPAIISATKKLPAPAYAVPDNCPRWLRKIIFWAPVRYNYGDVIISSPKGMDDDVILSKIEKPEELINYLNPIKPKPAEVAGYSAS